MPYLLDGDVATSYVRGAAASGSRPEFFSPQKGLAFFIFFFFLRELNVPGVRAPNLDGHPSWRRGEALRIINGSGTLWSHAHQRSRLPTTKELLQSYLDRDAVVQS